MADKLARWQRRAEYDSVFGFFSYVLTDGGRQKFCHQLGSSVDESLDHFLDLAQKFALTGGASLVQFGAAIRQGGGEVKRDMDAAGHDEVRVMTIHGAKGLEAPVVILPDMLRGKTVTDPLAPSADGRFYYWLPPATGVQPGFIEDAKAAAATLRNEENNRLLYVALTRACDGLVIGGWEKPHGVRKRDGSDYARLANAIAALPDAKHLDDGHILIETPQSRSLDDDRDPGLICHRWQSETIPRRRGYGRPHRLMIVVANRCAHHSPDPIRRHRRLLNLNWHNIVRSPWHAGASRIGFLRFYQHRRMNNGAPQQRGFVPVLLRCRPQSPLRLSNR